MVSEFTNLWAKKTYLVILAYFGSAINRLSAAKILSLIW
jgi:hypothetical protein